MARLPFLFGVFLVSLAVVHCAGLKPAPRYTSMPQDDSVAEPGYMDYEIRSTPSLGAVDGRQMTLMIKSYLGTPYVRGGASTFGVDCSGFVKVIFQGATKLNLAHNVKQMYSLGAPVGRGGLRFGDLVFFRDMERRGISHVGIYLARRKFVHASLSQGVIISDLDEDYYRVRYVGARRLLGEVIF